MSAPAFSTARISSPSRAKSADRIEGAILSPGSTSKDLLIDLEPVQRHQVSHAGVVAELTEHGGELSAVVCLMVGEMRHRDPHRHAVAAGRRHRIVDHVAREKLGRDFGGPCLDRGVGFRALETQRGEAAVQLLIEGANLDWTAVVVERARAIGADEPPHLHAVSQEQMVEGAMNRAEERMEVAAAIIVAERAAGV